MLITPSMLKAQTEPCGFNAVMQAEFLRDPAYKTRIEQMEQNPAPGQTPPDGIYRIPTVVHIIHNNELTASPNPASDQVVFTVEGTASDGSDFSIDVTDVAGKSVWSQNFKRESSAVNIIWNATQAPDGIYIYRLSSRNGKYQLTGKVVIQK